MTVKVKFYLVTLADVSTIENETAKVATAVVVNASTAKSAKDAVKESYSVSERATIKVLDVKKVSATIAIDEQQYITSAISDYVTIELHTPIAFVVWCE